ncbi:Response regulator receiver domain-containing protein [Lishizhenia tianjinensis]|uniref:Response regulator receiver domain-containing protein n=1 Tax=Lishizhenia tianjinensis TaxID=477690 RepID=A0A1I7BU02_9FLAO|nr:response regulator [Lishizhenia tianjinensis]SFT90652.1 Response regulator receiver domain-containing protein [Lishizhenia tianjinensis]
MSRKIVIVDDEPNIVMSLEYAFKKKGFQVFIARDGEEAYETISREVPDAVILDIMMPKVDGFQTLERIKANPDLKNCSVVFLSAKNKESDIAKGLELGADKYLVKPFSVKKVISEVQELL